MRIFSRANLYMFNGNKWLGSACSGMMRKHLGSGAVTSASPATAFSYRGFTTEA